VSSVLVRDFTANAEENIVHAANVIGRSPIRQAIFKAIYHHKAKVKSVEDIRKRTGLIRMRILQEAGRFASKRIVDKAKKNGDTAYGKHDDLHAYKNQILARANSKAEPEGHRQTHEGRFDQRTLGQSAPTVYRRYRFL
jgi:hypothetical protein